MCVTPTKWISGTFRVPFKISDDHPCKFCMGVPPSPEAYFIKKAEFLF